MGVVETSQGPVRGSFAGGVHAFRGIPYAAPPVGELRFRAPEPAEPWSEVRSAEHYAPYSPQLPDPVQQRYWLLSGESGEDCLGLNVWTPGLDAKRRPVLVWIHGGAFVVGASHRGVSDGAVLARRGDVVVVSMNYRLGALGWLDLESVDPGRFAGCGNQGLRDQIAALRWVRDNVERFGGDPDNVTLFGESAGGISVSVLLACDQARKLYHRAIAQSGSPHLVRSVARSRETAERFLRCAEVEDPAELWRLPTDRLLEAQERLLSDGNQDLAFGPITDGGLLPERPLAAIAEGCARHVPLLTGTTLDEYRYWLLEDPGLASLEPRHLAKRIRSVLGRDPAEVIEVYRRVRPELGENQLALWLIGDMAFWMPAIRLAEAHRRHQPDTWMYLMAWASPVLGGSLGALHAVDVPFVFGNLDVPNVPDLIGKDPERRVLSERMQDAWIAFARHGSPEHDGLPAWPTYDEAKRTTLVFDEPTRLASDPFGEIRELWQELPFDGLRPQIG